MFYTSSIKYFAILLTILFVYAECSLQEEVISDWANTLGKQLWDLGKTITKFSEIQGASRLKAQVEKKDPVTLLNGIVKDIERMMDRKMDAVECIRQRAEYVAENFDYNSSYYVYQYYSSKYSTLEHETESRIGEEDLPYQRAMYLQMKLNKDTHFYNLEVNTSHSSVHVPTNIYDRHDDASWAIQWSEALDDVFRQNYNSDPALSWQYFGSTTGIMRHYPAKRWEELEKDLFDCRIRPWFIEAATCTKDVVLLIDTSGSMDGMGRHIASLIAYSILDTFSNNDYINVLTYNLTTNYSIPCFEGMLVQATKENIRFFKKAIQTLKVQNKTDVSQALEVAFNLLAKYREKRNCTQDSSNCNQAIMVITDGIHRNMSDVVVKYNYLTEGGNTSIPVRIFTYLIGTEATNKPEIQWMSCANRGYYAHVQSLEQVTGSVLKYINVIARPLVLQAKEHPASWTHAYIDLTYDDKKDDFINEPYRLLTSVAVPAFDTRVNKDNETRKANLLGVAGTDVPIDDIEKLTLPYKVGVNAYAFIVSNNGYMLMHPDLRPVVDGHLTENYNSIDLTEVEQLDNDLPPRVRDPIILELRNALVNGLRGHRYKVPVKYHYDNMRRVTKELYNYYYAPISNTPFSLGLALPDSYGGYSLKVGDEIAENRHTGAKITDFFQGSNWKIHPKWVYCKYHYLEGHEYETPEKELLHFLGRMYDPDFKWTKQYLASDEEEDENLEKVECGRKTHGDDDYYCDKELVQRLVFDAKNTQSAFQGPWVKQLGLSRLIDTFNATLRFVATMSGLTRWEYLNEEIESEFGNIHNYAIDETWYKSAIIQGQYHSRSFVYSVPFENTPPENLFVTGSYAIYINATEMGKEAPGSVVGFQFVHSNLKRRVFELTTQISNQCPECGTCNTTLECYIIDNNGYIIVAEDDSFTGRFFGEIEGDIMDSMLNQSIFDKTTVYDFQSICDRDAGKNRTSDANFMITPFQYIKITVKWIFFKISWFLFELNMNEFLNAIKVHAEEYISFKTFSNGSLDSDQDGNSSFALENEFQEAEEEEEEEEEDPDRFYPCEKQRDLFILQQKLFHSGEHPIEILASRPYYIKKIPYSNLLFIAINTTMPRINHIHYSTALINIVYENQVVYPCQKLYLNSLRRRRLVGCFNENPLEQEIQDCGESSALLIKSNIIVIIIMLILCNYLC